MIRNIFALVFLFISIQLGFGQDSKNLPVKVFILAGQSNMDGCGIGEELPKKYNSPPENVLVWDNNKKLWVELGETTFSIRRKKQFGPEMAFSHALAAAYPDHTIALVKTSGGGTKLYSQWVPDSVMYRHCFSNLENATGQLTEAKQSYEICGMLWMQGESDSETLEMANAYERNLKLLFADVRRRTLKPDLPIVIGRISSSLLKKTPWVFDQAEIVQKAQDDVAMADPFIRIINTDKFSTLEDNTHFDTKAQLKLGKKMAKLMLLQLNTKNN